jgi:hypothetical protein
MEEYGTSAPSNKKKRNGREEDVFDGNSLWNDPEFQSAATGLQTPPVELGYSGEGWTGGMANTANTEPTAPLTFSAEFYYQRGNLNLSGDMKVEAPPSDNGSLKLQIDFNSASASNAMQVTQQQQQQQQHQHQQMLFAQQNHMQPSGSPFANQYNNNNVAMANPMSPQSLHASPFVQQQVQYGLNSQFNMQSYPQQQHQQQQQNYGQFNAQSNFAHTIHTMPFSMSSHPDFTTHAPSSSPQSNAPFNNSHFAPPQQPQLTQNPNFVTTNPNQMNLFATQQQLLQQQQQQQQSQNQPSSPYILQTSTPPLSPALPLQSFVLGGMEVESAKTLNQCKPSENAQTINTLKSGVLQNQA